MEWARCTQNSAIYNAQQFAGLAADELAQKRQNLVCPACGRPAFFRKETQNDRDPCFGARPHAEGCNLSAAQAAAKASDQADAYADLLNPAKRVVVDFRFGAVTPVDRTLRPSEVQSVTTQDHPAAAGWGTNTVTHMRLRPLLRLLTSSPEFGASQIIIDMDGIGAVRACDFFVPFKGITAQHERLFIGVFGNIASAQYFPQDNAVWLNSGSCHEPSICVPLALAALLMDRFEVNDVGYFAGANVLLLGTVRISQFGKKYILLENPQHLMVDFARD